jgi:hypothetical protein
MRVHGVLRSLPTYLLTTVILLVLADRLLADSSPGWVLAPLLLVGAGVVLLRHPQMLRDPPALAWLLLLVPLAGACVMDQGILAPVLGVLVLVVAAWWARGARYAGAWRWWCALVRLPAVLLGHLRSDRRLIKAWRLLHNTRPFGADLVVWILPLVLGGVFSALFGVANPVIGQWFSDLGTWFSDLIDPEHLLPTPARIVLWWGIAALAWVLLRTRPPRLQPQRTAIPRQEVDRSAVVLRSLLVVNAVFAVQVAMDLAYLAGGLHLPAGMTYATYAHRGAWPLLAAALISATLVLVAFRPGGAAERSVWARRLVLLYLGQNVALTVAAMWRLWLYVDAYGLSAWRLGAAIWMGLIAVGLVLIAVRIVLARSNRWLVDANVLATLATLVCCSWMDVGGTVAWHNVRHCREVGGEGVPLDLAYLSSFGVEIAPALVWLSQHSQDPQVAQRAAQLAAQQRTIAQEYLRDWRAWTWVRSQVAQVHLDIGPRHFADHQ